MKHTEMINTIIKRKGYKTYLEIGLGNVRNFEAIKVPSKVGVDPNVESRLSETYKVPSDEFFRNNHRTFDFIFIDGLHYKEQVMRDVDNALTFLSTGGTIMVHDCNPPNRAAQTVPRETRIWTGDVWKAWVQLRGRSGIHQVCIEEDYGCGIITKGNQHRLEIPPELHYEDLVNNRKLFLNLVTWKQYERNYL